MDAIVGCRSSERCIYIQNDRSIRSISVILMPEDFRSKWDGDVKSPSELSIDSFLSTDTNNVKR